METEGALKMQHEQGTTQRDSEQDGPPTSMNPVSHGNFSKVVFTDIKKSYPPRTDIQISFHIIEGFQSNNKDWVGIFKVGWQNTKEYYTWISASSSMENHVLFKAYYLPKDEEYYQFCYVDYSGDVRGVSTPFQFTVDENENDIVIVTTPEEMENMNEENKILKTKIRELAEKNQILEAQFRTAIEKSNTLEKENMKKNQDLAEKNQILEAQFCTATEKNNILEKENMDMRNQVKYNEEENEMLKRNNLESQLLLIELKDLQTDLKQKTMELEKTEAEKKQLQNENKAKQGAVENLSDLLDKCKIEAAKQKETSEAQTSTLETEKGLNEELRRSLEEEKKKVSNLESNLKNASMMSRKAEDRIFKLQQQLTLQQEENANNVEEIKKLHARIAHLEANVNELKDKCEEHLRKIEIDKKMSCDLKELLNEKSNKLVESENKIRKLERDVRSAQESTACIEQMLTREQNESKKNNDLIMELKSIIELRRLEVADLTEAHKRKEEELETLNSQFMRAYATPTFPSSTTTSQAQGLAYGNPYEEIPMLIPENESLGLFGTGLEERTTQTPKIQTCPICDEVFQDVEQQVYNDHVMCHEVSIYD